MTRRAVLALAVPLVLGLSVAGVEISRRLHYATHKTRVITQPPPRSLNATEVSDNGSSGRPSEPLDSVSEADPRSPPAQSESPWKSYGSSQYGFEIGYPANWEFDASYEDNYGKPPSGHGRPAYAGETRTLFGLEMDGPGQSQEGGGDFEDGAIIEVHLTGTSGDFESWNLTRDHSWSLLSSTPTEWAKLNSSLLGGDGAETMAVDTNGFKGAIHIVCTGSNPCQPFWGGRRRLPHTAKWARPADQLEPDGWPQRFLLPKVLPANAFEFSIAKVSLNVNLIHGKPNDPELPANAVNALLISNTYHELADPQPILFQVSRALLSGGLLVVVDRQPNPANVGITESGEHEILVERVAQALRQAGFAIVSQQDNFIESDPDNEMWWLLVSRKPNTKPLYTHFPDKYRPSTRVDR